MPAQKRVTIFSPIQILHVLTLTGAKGEYGGPNRVAYEQCLKLQERGLGVHIFTGVLPTSIPQVREDIEESYEFVIPLLKAFPVSSLWAKNIPRRLYRLIKNVDLVHIHFARDLIPVMTAFICILLGKPFVTQTHGMVIKDKRLLIKVFDFLFTRVILNRSSINFVLSENELRDMRPFHFKSQSVLLPNGIDVSKSLEPVSENKSPQIVFCSRLQARKRPERFLMLANSVAKFNSSATFKIFGPDGGELNRVLSKIKSDQSLSAVTYEGAVPPNQVLGMLKSVDLLVLPSENEPFPMIVLEALSVGTPVLIMPSCGLASILKFKHPEMVVLEETDSALIDAFLSVFEKTQSVEDREKIRNFCRETFSIEEVTNVLEHHYRTLVSR